MLSTVLEVSKPQLGRMVLTPSIPGLLGLLAVALLGLCGHLLAQSQAAGLSDIPGPWLARYTNLWALCHALMVDDLGKKGPTKSQHYRRLQSRYGDVVRTGPRTVTVMDPHVVPLMYQVRAKLDKGDAYIPFRQPGVTTSLLSIRDDDTHGRYRKLVANAYSMSAVIGFERHVDDMILRFLQVLDQSAKDKTALNLTLWGYYFCLDVVSRVTMGSELGFMEGPGQDVFGLLHGVHQFGRYVGPVAQAPWLHYLLKDNVVLRKTKPSPFHKAIREGVERRLQQYAKSKSPAHTDLLSHFAEAHHAYPHIMTARQTTIQAGGNLIAGALSPGKTFETLFKWLVPREGAQTRLFEELRANNVSAPSSYNDTRELPYLSGIIKEAERLHTAASFTLERVTGPAGFELPSGVHIPPGINIGCSIETMNSDSRVYGADSEEFNPDRWSRQPKESEDAFLERMKLIETTSLTFGQGSRTCIGKNVFKLEAWKCIASVMSLYKFEQVPNHTDDLHVTVIRRSMA